MGGCRGAASDAGAGPAGAAEQPQPAGGRRDAADDDPRRTPDEGTDHGQAEAAPGSGGAVQGLDQGGGDDVYLPRGSFDGALPFTGFEFALLGFAGMWLRRSSSAA